MEFKHELIKMNDNLPFRMFEFEGQDGNYKVEKHWHPSLEIFLVLKGSMDFYINSEHYTLENGQFILVNSNEIHSVDCPNPNFTIVLQIPRKVFVDYGNGDDIFFESTRYEKDAYLIELIEHMYQAYEDKKYAYVFDVLGDFNKLLYVLLSKYKVPQIDKQRKQEYKRLEKLSKITDYIREHFMEDISLRSLSEQFGFSLTYLSRMFQKYAQISYKEYLMNLRADEAYKRLINTGDAIGKIAMECGFPDSRSMAKAFQKRYQILPREIRKTIKETKK